MFYHCIRKNNIDIRVPTVKRLYRSKTWTAGIFKSMIYFNRKLEWYFHNCLVLI